MAKNGKLSKVYIQQISKDWFGSVMGRMSGTDPFMQGQMWMDRISGTEPPVVTKPSNLVVVDRDELAKEIQRLCELGVWVSQIRKDTSTQDKDCFLGVCYETIHRCEVTHLEYVTFKQRYPQGGVKVEHGKVKSGEHDTG